MDPGNQERSFIIDELAWDSQYFGIKCAKVVLFKILSPLDWEELLNEFSPYQFVVIENRNSIIENAYNISCKTQAFLADINIQFSKKIKPDQQLQAAEIPESTHIFRGMPRDDRLFQLNQFQHSRFIEDPFLARLGGEGIYRQWLINSFENSEKIFIVSFNSNAEPDGYLLHSYSDNICTIELIAVASERKNQGIGSKLLSVLELSAIKQDCLQIKVGTQVKNVTAINFYHKNGFLQQACHQIYHLWRT
jgi:dTDP-4-amino-4,6-dideoxy-D-galactose acyltransferase